MNKWKRGLAALMCGALLTAGIPASLAEDIPAIIAEQDSGENIADLIAETEAEQWAQPVTAPTTAASLEIGGKGAILIEADSGRILYERDSHKRLPIASVTKVMTLLLVMEAIDSGQISMKDNVTCSATAASMGGSQIWLKENETMSVHDLVKAAAVVSANDACAALAEHISGSIEGFVAAMNDRAAKMGLKDTKFLDCSGLNDEAYSSAYDVAMMSRELIKHKTITEFTTIWMDTIRNGQSQLVNTNKLVRFYQGATGLKTGTTAAAGSCLSATAERHGLSLISVILGCGSTDERFGGARKMLDYGFANYGVYTPEVDAAQLKPIPVQRGLAEQVKVSAEKPSSILIKKGEEKSVTSEVTLSKDLEAPVIKGQTVGEVVVKLNGKKVASYPVKAAENVKRLTFFAAFSRLFQALSV